MTKKQIYFNQLVQYLSEPKENDPFNSFRMMLLGKTKDYQSIEDAPRLIPGVNCNEDGEEDTDNPH